MLKFAVNLQTLFPFISKKVFENLPITFVKLFVSIRYPQQKSVNAGFFSVMDRNVFEMTEKN